MRLSFGLAGIRSASVMEEDGRGYWWVGAMLAPILALGIRWTARKLGALIPEGRIKRLLTRELGTQKPKLPGK